MDLITIVISLCYLTLIVSLVAGEECAKQGPCSCKTSKYTLDLGPLKTGANPRFTTLVGDYEYQYEPCVALSEGCGTETPVSVCQKSKDQQKFDAGDVDSSLFQGDADDGTLKITYTGGSNPTRTSVISLQCACTEGEFSFKSEDPQAQYNFNLATRYACGSKAVPCPPADEGHGLSTGSVLLILFFVFLAVYFIAGVLFLKFARGAQGKEMVPNYEFWTALPGLIKDGFLFTCRGCKKDSSYSQI